MEQTCTKRPVIRHLLAAAVGTLAVTLPAVLSGCDRDTSTSKSSTTKTTQTPEGTKQTTETNEKTVEVERKR